MYYEKIASVYANSLCEFAEEKGVFHEIESDVADLDNLLTHSSLLFDLLGNPGISVQDKFESLDRIFKDTINFHTLVFLKVVISHRRQEYLPQILRIFKEIASVKQGKYKVEIVASEKMEQEMLDKISSIVQEKVKGKPVLTEIIDKEVIGGVVIKIGDQRIDASVKRQLDILRDELSKQKLGVAGFIGD
jgi:F-type H+-transporting ATPase subunit delta